MCGVARVTLSLALAIRFDVCTSYALTSCWLNARCWGSAAPRIIENQDSLANRGEPTPPRCVLFLEHCRKWDTTGVSTGSHWHRWKALASTSLHPFKSDLRRSKLQCETTWVDLRTGNFPLQFNFAGNFLNYGWNSHVLTHLGPLSSRVRNCVSQLANFWWVRMFLQRLGRGTGWKATKKLLLRACAYSCACIRPESAYLTPFFFLGLTRSRGIGAAVSTHSDWIPCL